MLARVASLALLFSVEGLHLADPNAKLGQVDAELTAAEGSEWPHFRRHPQTHRRSRGSKEEDYVTKKGDETARARVVVLVSGSVEHLLVSPVLSNVVRANARKGHQVDVFFGLTPPATLGKPGAVKHQEVADPKIASLLQMADEFSFNSTVMDYICQLARNHQAASCEWILESDDKVSLPPDATHRNIMTQLDPINTVDGKAVLQKWRSLSRLWGKAKANAKQARVEISAVVVARDDDYWLASRIVDVEAFQANPLQVSAMPCLEATGINDKAVVMGRQAADVLLHTYQAWQRGDLLLQGTRTPAEVWLRMATEGNLSMRPEPMFVAQARFTASGLPCFQQETFDLPEQGGDLERCFGESAEDSPLTSLFQTFSCETVNTAFYDKLWPQQVKRLQQMVANLARREERSPVVLTVIDHDEIEMAVGMLTSLQAAGEDASSLVVGTSNGICKALSDSDGVAGSKCIVMQPAQDVRRDLFKHAILTTVALSGLSDRIVYVSPRAVFMRPLTSQLVESDKHMLFARSTPSAARMDSTACSDTISDLARIDISLAYLADAPEVADTLLRAWAHMEQDEGLSQQAALASALSIDSYPEFAFLPCNSHTLQDSGSSHTDDILVAETPPGVERRRARAKKAADTMWIERLTAKKPDKKPKTDAQRQVEWDKQAETWRQAWAQRIQELQEDNNYNATAVREQRKLERQYRRTHKAKKHVRYLPPDEAAKVKAREEKWEADKERQKFEDMEKAESRRDQFRREVEKAQRIIDGRTQEAESAEPASQEEDMGAE